MQKTAPLLAVALAACIATAYSQTGQPASIPVIDPTTGLPITSSPGAIDPTTGLPITQEWIDKDWADPSVMTNGSAVPIVLANINFVGVPVETVAEQLRDRFANQFDIILPGGNNGENKSSEAKLQAAVNLQLHDATASQIFNAMNIYFEQSDVPLRWMLKMNGQRPTAILHILPTAPAADAPEKHIVVFVGDLVSGSATNQTLSLGQIVDAIAQVWAKAGLSPTNLNGHLDIYAPAQLLIVNGTQDQVALAQQTLASLKEKSAFDRNWELYKMGLISGLTAPKEKSAIDRASGNAANK